MAAGDVTSNLTGSVMGMTQVETTFTLTVKSLAATASETFTISGLNTIDRDINDWDEDGWSVNDTFTFTSVAGGGGASFTATVLTISGLTMTFNVTVGTPVNTSYTDGIMLITSDSLAAVYQYNLCENSESANYINKVDGSTQMYQHGALTSAYQAMTPAGIARSWVTGDCEIKRVSFAAGVATYMIRQDFIILPYYTQSLNQDYIDGTLPIDLFEGLKSLRHVWEIRLRQSLSNPNYDKVYTDDANLGSTGWTGENGNGIGANYSVVRNSIVDTVSSAVISQVQIDKKTKITGTITSAGLFSSGNTKVGAYVSALLTPSAYTAKPTLYKELWMYDNTIQTNGTPSGALTGVIKRFDVTFVDANTLTFELDTEFSAAQQLLLSAGQEILIQVETEDHTQTAANSDSMMMVLYKGALTRDSDVQGLAEWSEDDFKIQKHNDTDGGAGYTDLKVYIQDKVLVTGKLKVNPATGWIRGIKAQVVAYNDVTEEEFIIDDYICDLSSMAEIPSGVSGVNKQFFNLNTTRGYQLVSGDMFNRVRIGEEIDANPYRWGEHTLTPAEWTALLADVAFDTGYLTADYTPVFMDYYGTGWDFSTIIKASSQISVVPLSQGVPPNGAVLRYFCVLNSATALQTPGVRWGTAVLTPGANTVMFGTTVGNTNYAIIISDLTGGGFENIVKSATGFTIDAISATTVTYLVAEYTAAVGIESGVFTCAAGANSVTFNTPLASSDYTLFVKDYLNGANNLSNFVQTANGFTYDAIAAGEIHFIAKLN